MLIFFKTRHDYSVFHFPPPPYCSLTQPCGVFCLQITMHVYSTCISISGTAPRGSSGFETAQSDPWVTWDMVALLVRNRAPSSAGPIQGDDALTTPAAPTCALLPFFSRKINKNPLQLLNVPCPLATAVLSADDAVPCLQDCVLPL